MLDAVLAITIYYLEDRVFLFNKNNYNNNKYISSNQIN